VASRGISHLGRSSTRTFDPVVDPADRL